MKSLLEIHSMRYDIDRMIRFETDEAVLCQLKAEKSTISKAIFILELDASESAMRQELSKAREYVAMIRSNASHGSDYLKRHYPDIRHQEAKREYLYNKDLQRRESDIKALELILE